jgi:two-component system sensor histidine kinase MprB
MSLRKKVALVAGTAVLVAVLMMSVIAYLVVRGQLRNEVDGALSAEESTLLHHTMGLGGTLPAVSANAGGPIQYYQVVDQNGNTLVYNPIPLPVSGQVVAIANGNSTAAYFTDIVVNGDPLRQLTFAATLDNTGQPVAVQLARPLSGVNHILNNLRLILLLVCVGGVALAAVVARFAANRVLRPLAEVADTAKQIGETDDLSRRLTIHSDDEVGELARRFNAMLESLEGSRAALDESVRAQRQLVADASHELRTPVTSLRTNVEVLLADAELSEPDRQRLLADVVEQSEELTSLVGGLIELARGDQPAGEMEDIRLDRLVEESVAWANRNAQGVGFQTRLAPMTIEGDPERLVRAINNLLDNAARHSPPGGTVEVTVDEEGVTVRDHGTGVDEADLPYVFNRFFRGSNSRGTQGSGLGLAIVRQVTEHHGGTATVANAPDGGAIFTLHLPVMPIDQAAVGDHDGVTVGANSANRPLWRRPEQ